MGLQNQILALNESCINMYIINGEYEYHKIIMYLAMKINCVLSNYMYTLCHSIKSSYLGILIGFSTVVSMRTIM